MNEENNHKKRNGVIDLLKILATFCIIMHHYQQRTGAQGKILIFWDDPHFYFGYLVELFFIISGIVIWPEIEKIRIGNSFKDFFLKRYLRFLPTVALSVICYEILLVIYRIKIGTDLVGSEINWGGTLIAALSLQCWGFPNPTINNPVWYVSVLLLCYIILFIIIFISKKFRVLRFEYLCFFMIIVGGIIITNEWEYPLLNLYTGRGFYAFFTGVLLYELMRSWKCWLRYLITGIVTLGITLALIFLPDITKAGTVNWYGTNIILVFLYYPAMLLFLDNPLTVTLLSRSWIAFLAKISFGAFVWHHVIHTAFVVWMVVSGRYYDVSAPVIVGTMLCMDYLAGILIYFCSKRVFYDHRSTHKDMNA